MSETESLPYGLMVELSSQEALLVAAKKAKEAGYKSMNAYTPFPVEEVNELISPEPSRLPLLVLIGGLIGAIGGFGMQYYSSVVAYPINIGGRPLNSWPAFVPVTFEFTILIAAIFAVWGMLALNRLPRPHHPVFGVDAFSRASVDRFFLLIRSRDPLFERKATETFLQSLQPDEIHVVQ